MISVIEVPEKNVRALFNNLTDIEERIIRLRYGLDDGKCRSLEEVSKQLGVAREKIRQIEIKAILKMRNNRHIAA